MKYLKVRSLDFDEYKEMQKLLELMEDQGELDHDDEDTYYGLKRQGEKEILVITANNFRVIA